MMPSQNSLERLKTKRLWREQESRRQMERRRFLPDDLVEHILEAAAEERARLLARIEVIDVRLEDLDMQRQRAKEAVQAVMLVRRAPDRRRRRADGTVQVVKGRETRVLGDVAVERRRVQRDIEETMAALRQERQLRKSELNDVAKVERAADVGLESAVLAITRQWTGRVNLGELVERVPLARHFVDALGYDLPEDMTPEEYAELLESRPRPNSNQPLEV